MDKNELKVNKPNVIETRTSKTFLRDDGIIQCELLPNTEINLTDAIESVKAGKSISGGRKRPVLVIFGTVKSISREAREYFGGKETTDHTLAIALLISSVTGRVIGNFMIGLNKTLYPTRLFTNEDEAVKWLKGFSE